MTYVALLLDNLLGDLFLTSSCFMVVLKAFFGSSSIRKRKRSKSSWRYSSYLCEDIGGQRLARQGLER